MPGVLNHIHKYFKFKDLWHCALCSHYMPKNVPPPVGQPSKCWNCEEPFVLNSHNMQNTHPFCNGCIGATDVKSNRLN
jgi:formylmethanofuran dehydrogenase subunit E